MAKTSKSGKSEKVDAQSAEEPLETSDDDGEAIEATPEDDEAGEAEAEAAEPTSEEPDIGEPQVVEGVILETEPGEDSVSDAATDEDADNEPPAAVPAPVETRVVERRGGFLPLLLGGLLAGGIGYGAAWLQAQDGSPQDEALAAVDERITSLESELADLGTGPDLTDFEAGIAAQLDSLSAENAALASDLEAQSSESLGRLNQLDERLTDVEQRPSGDGGLSEGAVEAYEREVAALRESVAAQRQELQAALAAALAELEAARAEVAAAETSAMEAASEANARAALNRIQAALETGSPYASALADLRETTSVEVPPALAQAAETGVATLADLQSGFPAAARSALEAARDEGLSSDGGGLGGFFRSQLQVRSVAPRDGDDPDAVLSRAEAALADGRVGDALAEVATLPEVVRAEMSSWIALAEGRIDAIGAAGSLSNEINSN